MTNISGIIDSLQSNLQERVGRKRVAESKKLRESIVDDAWDIIGYYDKGGHGGIGEAVDTGVEIIFDNLINQSGLNFDEDTGTFKCTREELSNAYDEIVGNGYDSLEYYGLSPREIEIVSKGFKEEFLDDYTNKSVYESRRKQISRKRDA